ncbi:casein kinase I isoform delta [Gracilaria domingensis]|nr:casein kinase I isoform delta [Gracilaria domingensis]
MPRRYLGEEILCRVSTASTNFWAARQGKYSVMVMTLFDKSLGDFKAARGGRLSMQCVLKVGINLIKVIREIHSKGIVHLDLKPSNIMTQTSGERKNRLHVIDFGMARLYRCLRTGKHISKGPSRYFNGTIVFASQRTHRYKQVSRRDDMESLAYLLVYLATGTLPWYFLSRSNSESEIREMGDMKRRMPTEDICEGTVGIKEYLAIPGWKLL